MMRIKPKSQPFDSPRVNSTAFIRPEPRPRGFACLREAPLCGAKAGVDPALRWTQGLELVKRRFDGSMQVALRQPILIGGVWRRRTGQGNRKLTVKRLQEYNDLMRGVLCFVSHAGESMGNKKGVDAQ